jgi:hypothetical protein
MRREQRLDLIVQVSPVAFVPLEQSGLVQSSAFHVLEVEDHLLAPVNHPGVEVQRVYRGCGSMVMSWLRVEDETIAICRCKSRQCSASLLK